MMCLKIRQQEVKYFSLNLDKRQEITITLTIEAKQRPQKKTTESGESKPKSGPLKLGQKKQPQDFF